MTSIELPVDSISPGNCNGHLHDCGITGSLYKVTHLFKMTPANWSESRAQDNPGSGYLKKTDRLRQSLP